MKPKTNYYKPNKVLIKNYPTVKEVLATKTKNLKTLIPPKAVYNNLNNLCKLTASNKMEMGNNKWWKTRNLPIIIIG